MTARGGGAVALALARACHPAPTVAVTCFATVLGASAGNSAGTCVLLAAAVLAGQLSIGWSNDRLDADRDRRAGRQDKPLARDELAARQAERAIAVVLPATVVLSLLLGWRAGLVHLAAVGCGWLYNAWLKRTWFSWLPYAAAFGALPAVATLALPVRAAPAAWVVIAGALFGVTAHLANVLPDLADDRATGVQGLPHRLGARLSLGLAVVLLIAASGFVTFGPPGPAPALGWVVVGVAVAVGLAGTVRYWRRSPGRTPFLAIIGVVGFDLVLIVVAGHHLR